MIHQHIRLHNQIIQEMNMIATQIKIAGRVTINQMVCGLVEPHGLIMIVQGNQDLEMCQMHPWEIIQLLLHVATRAKVGRAEIVVEEAVKLRNDRRGHLIKTHFLHPHHQLIAHHNMIGHMIMILLLVLDILHTIILQTTIGILIRVPVTNRRLNHLHVVGVQGNVLLPLPKDLVMVGHQENLLHDPQKGQVMDGLQEILHHPLQTGLARVGRQGNALHLRPIDRVKDGRQESALLHLLKDQVQGGRPESALRRLPTDQVRDGRPGSVLRPHQNDRVKVGHQENVPHHLQKGPGTVGHLGNDRLTDGHRKVDNHLLPMVGMEKDPLLLLHHLQWLAHHYHQKVAVDGAIRRILSLQLNQLLVLSMLTLTTTIS